MAKTYKAVLYWTPSLNQESTPFFTESELISEARDHCMQTGEDDEKNICSIDDAIRYLEGQGWFPIEETTQYFTEEEIENTSVTKEHSSLDESDKKMIEYLPELVHELQKQGYEWKRPVEVKPDIVRVRDGESLDYVYDVSRKGDAFEVSLYIEGKTGQLTEVQPVIRETIEQVVDYILE